MLSRVLRSQVKQNSYFLVGLAIGLWVSLAVIPLEDDLDVACETGSSAAPLVDEFEPQREEKPLGSGGQTAGRSVQRPRYYSTELGMRGSLLTGVLSSEGALGGRAAALNRTAARLQPALKFFITASAMSTAPGLANVVGFTDTREMLRPFHALKYLADNYLEEYDFFFLVSDGSFVNARRLNELVAKLSVSRDVYMGAVADDDSHYCSLESGIILSNSVLRAVHGELDWCVRNSYSGQHHENLGRCVLHAAHLSCMSSLQGESYESAAWAASGWERLADAVTVARVPEPGLYYQLHAYVSRVYLERDRDEVKRLRGYVWRNSARHPPGFRNATWPAGLRDEPGLRAPPPDSRFDHLRWTLFNDTHAFMPDEHRAAAALAGAQRAGVALVAREATAWAHRRWGLTPRLLEGAWRWEPAHALRYRLLLALPADPPRVVCVEVCRALGAARLAPARYVTESARVSVLVAVPLYRDARDARDSLVGFLARYDGVALAQDKNTELTVALVRAPGDNATLAAELGAAAAALASRRGAVVDTLEVQLDARPPPGDDTPERAQERAAALALDAVKLPSSALVLILPPYMEFNQDFLNRVRMNTIQGEQWFLPVPFARFAQYEHPRFSTAGGGKPHVHTGRFNLHHRTALAFYKADYDTARASVGAGADADVARVLARSPLRALRAPEPGLVARARPTPCHDAACRRALADDDFAPLDLGARSTLAQLLLETQAERASLAGQ